VACSSFGEAECGFLILLLIFSVFVFTFPVRCIVLEFHLGQRFHDQRSAEETCNTFAQSFLDVSMLAVPLGERKRAKTLNVRFKSICVFKRIQLFM
jgi:hypothetical protein